MRTVAAVIVTYNRRDKLCHCLDALLCQDAPELEHLVVVDNHSTDGTREAVRAVSERAARGSRDGGEESFRPEIHYVNTGCNLGGAGGFARGICMADEIGCDYVWLMDDDCLPEPGALRALLKADERLGGPESYGFLSSRVLWTDGSLCRMNIQRRTLMRKVRTERLENPEKGELMPAVMASFVSLFVPMEIVRRHGLPIREFFVWTDDWEFTRRISREHPCYIAADSTVIHDTQENAGADIVTAPAERLDRFIYLYRNDVCLYRREGIRGFAYEAVRLPGHLARIAVSRRTMKDKLKRAGIVIRGTARGLRFHPVPGRLPVSNKRRSI